MFTTPQEVIDFIKETDVKFLDVRFTDLPGVQQHFNVPAATVDLDFFEVGEKLIFGQHHAAPVR